MEENNDFDFYHIKERAKSKEIFGLILKSLRKINKVIFLNLLTMRVIRIRQSCKSSNLSLEI